MSAMAIIRLHAGEMLGLVRDEARPDVGVEHHDPLAVLAPHQAS